jgi:hypothetical protein
MLIATCQKLSLLLAYSGAMNIVLAMETYFWFAPPPGGTTAVPETSSHSPEVEKSRLPQVTLPTPEIVMVYVDPTPASRTNAEQDIVAPATSCGYCVTYN